jgi:hypothetical protein
MLVCLLAQLKQQRLALHCTAWSDGSSSRSSSSSEWVRYFAAVTAGGLLPLLPSWLSRCSSSSNAAENQGLQAALLAAAAGGLGGPDGHVLLHLQYAADLFGDVVAGWGGRGR